MDFIWVAHTNFLVLICWFKLRRFNVCRQEAATSANDSEARDACTCKYNAKQCAICDDLEYLAKVWTCKK